MRLTRNGTVALATIAVAAITLPTTLTSTARADPYKWCAEYGPPMDATNCGFVTFQQCLATISGIGGFCEPNPRYTGPERRPHHHAYRRHRHYRDYYYR